MLVYVNGRLAAPKGHILDDTSNMRKMLGGGLPITADGYYVAASYVGDLYQPEKDRIMAWGPHNWRQWAPVDFALSYSTEAAARQAAAQGKIGEGK